MKIAQYEFGDYFAAIELKFIDDTVVYVTKFDSMEDFVIQFGNCRAAQAYTRDEPDHPRHYVSVTPIIGVNAIFEKLPFDWKTEAKKDE